MDKRILKPSSIHPECKAEIDNVMPQVQIEDIPSHRRKQLLDITSFTGLETEEWFEEWLAVWLDFEFEDMELGRETAWYYRKLFKMKKKLESWKRENLQPLEIKLLETLQQPHYHYAYLYELELRKIECIRAHLVNCHALGDKYGNFSEKYWMEIAIKLLRILVALSDDKNIITKQKLKKMNIRNLKGIVHQESLEEYINEKDRYSKFLKGVEIYKRKVERLYYHIRLNYTQTWWI